ncbi:MAG: hypothetical protein P857_389 [Candidatus Xenolissoclinum pacificiensis L6]|uniref:Uncharacterized protein n=1 Tax=Candidatus Xenolissoclinum pacificiensis L6 TaxID=1401685 RepID=W2UZR6_9RICK|nr:MAG: hypothetical protein P857_389 [Candidatus Xenolissoclinum pacificiensis L6]
MHKTSFPHFIHEIQKYHNIHDTENETLVIKKLLTKKNIIQFINYLQTNIDTILDTCSHQVSLLIEQLDHQSYNLKIDIINILLSLNIIINEEKIDIKFVDDVLSKINHNFTRVQTLAYRSCNKNSNIHAILNSVAILYEEHNTPEPKTENTHHELHDHFLEDDHHVEDLDKNFLNNSVQQKSIINKSERHKLIFKILFVAIRYTIKHSLNTVPDEKLLISMLYNLAHHLSQYQNSRVLNRILQRLKSNISPVHQSYSPELYNRIFENMMESLQLILKVIPIPSEITTILSVPINVTISAVEENSKILVFYHALIQASLIIKIYRIYNALTDDQQTEYQQMVLGIYSMNPVISMPDGDKNTIFSQIISSTLWYKYPNNISMVNKILFDFWSIQQKHKKNQNILEKIKTQESQFLKSLLKISIDWNDSSHANDQILHLINETAEKILLL